LVRLVLAIQEGDGNPWRGIVLQTEQHRMAFVTYPAIIPRDIPALDSVQSVNHGSKTDEGGLRVIRPRQTLSFHVARTRDAGLHVDPSVQLQQCPAKKDGDGCPLPTGGMPGANDHI